MTDAAIHDLARRAGIAVEWADHAGRLQRVSIASIKSILAALGLPCATPDDLSQSKEALKAPKMPPLVAATVGQPVELPVVTKAGTGRVRATLEDGRTLDLAVHAAPRGIRLSAIEMPGYHTVDLGGTAVTLAVAPKRCLTIGELAPNERFWALAVQIYALRRAGDCGIGDAAGVIALARHAAALKADALGLSPVHAQFAADPSQFSPYSPSSRVFYNPLHADARLVFGADRVEKIFHESGVLAVADELEHRSLIDWPQSTRVKMSLLRHLFEDFAATDLVAAQPTLLAADFTKYRTAGGAPLEDHARFETLQQQMLAQNSAAWCWNEWPAPLRDPKSSEVASFAERCKQDITFHCFLQWLADRSLGAAQSATRAAGMRLGLISDLAVGMSGNGSQAWTGQKDILAGLEIGAPPDFYNSNGQNWGLTTFSPRALSDNGFAPFIATLRAALRHAGGVRIDHVMGLLRLWVVPRGADAKEGAYLAYPVDGLMRLTALESYRHRAIVIGEDLGTVPAGFRERLADTGIYGMRVLYFQRERGRFAPPQSWRPDTVAMTSTHDLPTVAGWWRGKDIETRAQLGLVANVSDEQSQRSKDRRALWRAFRRARAAVGELPALGDAAPVVDAAVEFVAQTKSELAILPVEDALALEDQPNLPGTIAEHPNWRRRYPGAADTLLDAAQTRRRLEPMARRDRP